MSEKYTVKLKKIVDEFHLKPLHLSKDYENTILTVADVNRPALQLTGFYDYFDERRLQIIGRVENTYMNTLTEEQRMESSMVFMSYNIPAVVVCHGVEPTKELLETAGKFDRNVFYTDEDTSSFQANVISSLRHHLAPRITTHGVLVEVYGEGILITGDSGIGKSETALELIKRGHRLIADDAVEIKKVNWNELEGTAPEIIRYYMEVRGIGIVNVRHLYGMAAVKPLTTIDMVVNLEPWVEGKAYDRLGLDSESETILDVTLPKVTVPVRPGRNLAVILELAAMNNRQKKMGYDAAASFTAEHDSAVDAGLL